MILVRLEPHIQIFSAIQSCFNILVNIWLVLFYFLGKAICINIFDIFIFCICIHCKMLKDFS